MRQSGAHVYIAEVANTQATEVRGEQLLAQVEELLALTGQKKVNLIGHSHGGLTARYVAGVRSDLVASVTTIGTPNHGSQVADFIRQVPENSMTEVFLNSVVWSFSKLIDYLSGGERHQDPLAALDSLTGAGVEKFNQDFPEALSTTPCSQGSNQVKGVYYFSWSGSQIMTNWCPFINESFLQH